MSQLTFKSFQDQCGRCVAAAPLCAAWVLSYREEDFGREWFVTARAGTFGALIQVFAANTTTMNVPDVIATLGKMLEELRTGGVDASPRRQAILDELRAAGLR